MVDIKGVVRSKRLANYAMKRGFAGQERVYPMLRDDSSPGESHKTDKKLTTKVGEVPGRPPNSPGFRPNLQGSLT